MTHIQNKQNTVKLSNNMGIIRNTISDSVSTYNSNVYNINGDVTLKIDDMTITAKELAQKLKLLDRILIREFPEEYIR